MVISNQRYFELINRISYGLFTEAEWVEWDDDEEGETDGNTPK